MEPKEKCEINCLEKKAEIKSSDSKYFLLFDINSSSHVSLILISLLILSIIILNQVWNNFPELEIGDKPYFKIPWNEEDAKNLGFVLSKYTDKHYYTVLTGILVLYIFLQSFAIPGSILLSIISGYLFPLPIALILVCLCSAIGASICYMLSYCFGRKLVIKYFPEKVTQFSVQVAKNRSDLLSYILFLRITPIIPNWVINIVSPLIDVPLLAFFWGTFFGVAPPSFLHIQAAKTLNNMAYNRGSSAINFLLLIIFALLSLLPAFLNRWRKRFSNTIDTAAT